MSEPKLCAREGCNHPVTGPRPSHIRKKRFCSHECYALAKTGTATFGQRQRPACGTNFDANRSRRKFCDKSCAGLYHAAQRTVPPKDHPCRGCGEPTPADRKYCGPVCLHASRAAVTTAMHERRKAMFAEAMARKSRKPLPGCLPKVAQSEERRLIAEWLARHGATRGETRFCAPTRAAL